MKEIVKFELDTADNHTILWNMTREGTTVTIGKSETIGDDPDGAHEETTEVRVYAPGRDPIFLTGDEWRAVEDQDLEAVLLSKVLDTPDEVQGWLNEVEAQYDEDEEEA